MTLKSKMSLLVSLTSISIISVGFSSWSITAESNAEIGGNIKVDNVINNTNCISIVNEAPSCFTYGKKGFVDSNGHFIQNGSIEAEYLLNLDECQKLIAGYDSLAIDISIFYTENSKTNFDLFTSTDDITFTYKIHVDEEEVISKTASYIDNGYMVTFNMNNVFENYQTGVNYLRTINVEFLWNIPNAQYFETTVYPELYDSINNVNKAEFEITAVVKGK